MEVECMVVFGAGDDQLIYCDADRELEIISSGFKFGRAVHAWCLFYATRILSA